MFDETPEQAWRLRYGSDAGELAPVGRLLNHRSVRKYREEPISEMTVATLVGAAQSAATSSNLQLYSVVSVQDPERREAVAKIAADQDQIRTASWFFVFLADHHRLRTAAAEVGEAAEALDTTEFYTMSVVDAALAAERMVCAAESIGIGICYIGAVRNDPEAMRRILDLPRETFALFGLCLGYPAEGIRADIKPRLSQSEVWHRETYRRESDVAEYDARMRAFYEEQRMKGDVTWSMRSGRRADDDHLEGRDGQLDWLRNCGFLLR